MKIAPQWVVDSEAPDRRRLGEREVRELEHARACRKPCSIARAKVASSRYSRSSAAYAGIERSLVWSSAPTASIPTSRPANAARPRPRAQRIPIPCSLHEQRNCEEAENAMKTEMRFQAEAAESRGTSRATRRRRSFRQGSRQAPGRLRTASADPQPAVAAVSS